MKLNGVEAGDVPVMQVVTGAIGASLFVGAMLTWLAGDDGPVPLMVAFCGTGLVLASILLGWAGTRCERTNEDRED